MAEKAKPDVNSTLCGQRLRRVIHTPNLAAVKFTGNFDKRLFELGGRETPILKAQDENIIVVSKLQAALLCKQVHFEKVDIKEVFASKKSLVYQAPFKEDLEHLSLEEIKTACLYFNITIGNKKIDTLKSLLLPFLESKDKDDTSK